MKKSKNSKILLNYEHVLNYLGNVEKMRQVLIMARNVISMQKITTIKI